MLRGQIKKNCPTACSPISLSTFSEYNLSNENVHPDILGQAYEYLIKQFADLTNKKAGEFYTPRSVVHLMGLIIDPKEGESVYDPACGTGGMLLECIESLRQRGKDPRTLKVYGQEKNITTSSIARINMFLHGVEDFEIGRGDTLRNPAFYEGDKLATFDCVIANPPFSLKKWGDDLWLSDPYNRNFAGVPPEGNGDLAWVQHMIKSMSYPHGRVAVVLPHGALFRKGKEGEIRKKILEMDILEAVIGLGANIFYGASLSACVLVFRANKSNEKERKVLSLTRRIRSRSDARKTTWKKNILIESFLGTNHSKTCKNYAKVATIDQINENDGNLNIPLYVEKELKMIFPVSIKQK